LLQESRNGRGARARYGPIRTGNAICKGHDSVMLLSTNEYNPLNRRDREAMSLTDFADADIIAIKNFKPSAAATAFNNEMKT
jgi:hypothetical protein